MSYTQLAILPTHSATTRLFETRMLLSVLDMVAEPENKREKEQESRERESEGERERERMRKRE